MSICNLSLIFLALIPIILFVFRKPSKHELKKFESKNQDRLNWSRMGF